MNKALSLQQCPASRLGLVPGLAKIGPVLLSKRKIPVSGEISAVQIQGACSTVFGARRYDSGCTGQNGTIFITMVSASNKAGRQFFPSPSNFCPNFFFFVPPNRNAASHI
uniref:Uncharacterized protein n=1 Tax=Opuntia streptacantha TaxID=393608 RepID=A0A7C9CXR1_OPUST